MAIISLTSIPSRFSRLSDSFESLARQSARIDEIRLYLPRRYRRFPDYRGETPDVPRFVRLIEVEEDLGPATKMLFAARDLAGETTPILFCDDDKIYGRHWARRLLRAAWLHPEACITGFGNRLAQFVPEQGNPPLRRPATIGRELFDPRFESLKRLRKALAPALRKHVPKPKRRKVIWPGHVELLYGFGGVVVRPGFVDAPFYDIPDSLWMVDDLWFAGHLARRGIPIWAPAQMEFPGRSESHFADPLFAFEYKGAGRLDSNRHAIAYFQETYGVWQTGGAD